MEMFLSGLFVRGNYKHSVSIERRRRKALGSFEGCQPGPIFMQEERL